MPKKKLQFLSKTIYNTKHIKKTLDLRKLAELERTNALKGWKDVPEKVFGAPLKGGSVGAEVSPELVGVGYIIGPRIAGVIFAGGVFAWLVVMPAVWAVVSWLT